jgi:hypothetical protein
MASGKDKGNDNGNGHDKSFELQISVNGTPITMEVKLNQPLQAILVPALKEAGVAGDPEPDRWLFRDAAGNVLDKHQKISEFDFGADTILFLSLEAGVAG